MCIVTERMDDYEPEVDEAEAMQPHNITCVASVSFDRNKK